jgi:uncharacterized protein
MFNPLCAAGIAPVGTLSFLEPAMLSRFPQTSFDVEPTLPSATSDRARAVAQHFGVLSMLPTQSPAASDRPSLVPPLPDAPSPGEIMLLSGASGSGKSSLLRSIVRKAGRQSVRVCRLESIRLRQVPVVDLFDDEPLEQTLPRLARVGLAEVWTWLRRPGELSEGQRWRLRLAVALRDVERGSLVQGHPPRPTLLVCDEFAAMLDRISACVAASVLRRAVTRHADRLAAVVASSHDDLRRALAPDLHVTCDFGHYCVTRPARKRWPVEHGT